MTKHETITASHENIYVALAAAQQEMGTVIKGAMNPHFKRKYADLADVMQVALPALNAHGIAPFAHIVTADGERYMRTVLAHGASGTTIECDVPLLVSKGDMQAMKSATTYAKRIGIESLTGIAPEDDDGNAAKDGADTFRREAEQKQADQFVEYRTGAIARLTQAPTLEALQTVWLSLPPDMKADATVLSAKDDMKASLSKPLVDDEIPYGGPNG